MASKKTSTKAKETLADFIRSQPTSMGPTAVVAAAKKAGYGKVDPTYVSKVRPMGGAKKKAAQETIGRARPHPPRPGGRVPKSAPAEDHGEEAMIRFLELAKALGKDRARRLVELL